MDARILKLTPKRYQCPYCGEWHEWNRNQPLYWNKIVLDCPNGPGNRRIGKYTISFLNVVNEECCYSTERICGLAALNLNGKILISDIHESRDEPIIRFNVRFTSYGSLTRCNGCDFQSKCNVWRLGNGNLSDEMSIYITFGFEFDELEYNEIVKAGQLENQKEESNMKKENGAKSIDINELARSMGINFGFNTDSRIKSTLLGTVVQYDENRYHGFDRNIRIMTDYTGISTVNLPILIVPASTVWICESTILHLLQRRTSESTSNVLLTRET